MIATLRTALITLLCLCISAAAGYWVSARTITSIKEQTNHDISNQLTMLKSDLGLELGHMSNALAFLVDQINLHNPIQDIQSTGTLSEDFLSFLRTSTLFDQIRLLNMDGQEVMRANYNNGHPALASELQNKSDRYYFREGLKLKRGEVYVSPFDLNMENGHIEEPEKPTIRLLQPVYTPGGEKIGLLVINALGTAILTHLQMEMAASSAQHVSLLNEEGFWLAGPEKQDLWAFMFPGRENRTLANQAPQAWQAISRTKRSVSHDHGGTYISDTISPADLFSNFGLRVNGPTRREWKLVAYYSDAYIDARVAGEHHMMMSGAIAFGIAIAIIILGLQRLIRESRLHRLAEIRSLEAKAEQEKTAAMVTIAGGIGHEFNNILTGIIGATYLIRSKLADRPELQARLHTIDHSCQRAAGLVKHLMTFAQVDIFEKSGLILNELINRQATAIPRPDNITLSLDVTPAPLYLEADYNKLEAMLQHLLSNAIDAIADKTAGNIRLSLAATTADTLQYASLTIEDNGCGISPENLASVFDPFFTTKPQGEGVGLGLSLVHGVVHSLAGKISINSTPGHGTRVDILLPLTNAKNHGNAD
ncbi:hypothetical protein FEF65_04415 [Mariprofundus erugo]|uniref:histidine kinase n=1 Tax=Mariprofundus erugo TaxID=2528639 RepID=A0A5R9GVF6_9PROT|nr:sensor histidine kinase [Mariprofundus erugo]TLS68243.1 hypothetical protein FEF65_04415 [Mariprofundus erugo]